MGQKHAACTDVSMLVDRRQDPGQGGPVQRGIPEPAGDPE